MFVIKISWLELIQTRFLRPYAFTNKPLWFARHLLDRQKEEGVGVFLSLSFPKHSSWAMTTLYLKDLAPAQKPYRIGLLLTHRNGDFRAVSVTKRSCTVPLLTRVLKVETRPGYFSCWHVIFSLKQFAGVMVCSYWSREKSGGITWLVELRCHLDNSMILNR